MFTLLQNFVEDWQDSSQKFSSLLFTSRLEVFSEMCRILCAFLFLIKEGDKNLIARAGARTLDR